MQHAWPSAQSSRIKLHAPYSHLSALHATKPCPYSQNLQSYYICAVAEGVAPWSAVVARGSRDQDHFRNESSDQVVLELRSSDQGRFCRIKDFDPGRNASTFDA